MTRNHQNYATFIGIQSSPTLQITVTQECMTVVISDELQLKLLEVPSYFKPSGKSCGKIIAKLSIKLMTKWHCDDQIFYMTFDTTSPNAGHSTAACIAI